MEAVDSSIARRVGVGPRAVALVIDMFLLALVPGVPLTLLLGERTVTRDPAGTSVAYDWQLGTKGCLVWAVLAFAYFILSEASSGATLGKRILQLRVVHADGSPIGFGAALTRNLFRLVDGFPYVLPYLAGAVSIWSDGDRRRLGDRAAGTIVTYR